MQLRSKIGNKNPSPARRSAPRSGAAGLGGCSAPPRPGRRLGWGGPRRPRTFVGRGAAGARRSAEGARCPPARSAPARSAPAPRAHSRPRGRGRAPPPAAGGLRDVSARRGLPCPRAAARRGRGRRARAPGRPRRGGGTGGRRDRRSPRSRPGPAPQTAPKAPGFARSAGRALAGWGRSRGARPAPAGGCRVVPVPPRPRHESRRASGFLRTERSQTQRFKEKTRTIGKETGAENLQVAVWPRLTRCKRRREPRRHAQELFPGFVSNHPL